MNEAVHLWAAQILGHRFSNPKLLTEALTHPSLAGANYERLEFLGDRVLALVISAELFTRFPHEPEGQLTRRMHELVSRDTCAKVARTLDLTRHVRLAQSTRAAGGQHNTNVLGDVCEALIGALYLDGGLTIARSFILQGWASWLEEGRSAVKDPKNALQEWAQARNFGLPRYLAIGRTGPDHAPEFKVEASVGSYPPATGLGATKQEAQKQAATALLAQLTESFPS